jgi:hypothetical protein
LNIQDGTVITAFLKLSVNLKALVMPTVGSLGLSQSRQTLISICFQGSHWPFSAPASQQAALLVITLSCCMHNGGYQGHYGYNLKYKTVPSGILTKLVTEGCNNTPEASDEFQLLLHLPLGQIK